MECRLIIGSFISGIYAYKWCVYLLLVSRLIISMWHIKRYIGL
jgi:hypothetical protein